MLLLIQGKNKFEFELGLIDWVLVILRIKNEQIIFRMARIITTSKQSDGRILDFEKKVPSCLFGQQRGNYTVYFGLDPRSHDPIFILGI